MKSILWNRNKYRFELVFQILIASAIFFYPFINSFFGLDLGDTGFHAYAFERLFTHTEFISFTSYFTNLFAWSWLQVFGFLGLWGLNLLEVIIEMIMAIVVYKSFSKHLGKTFTLLGILIAVVASDTYLNIFNYHQFNVLFLVLICCAQFKAITEDRVIFTILAGIAFVFVFFSRTCSITAITTCVFYLIWYWYNDDSKLKFVFKHLGVFFSSTIVTAGVVAICMACLGHLEGFINNIFRLSGLASDGNSGYGFSSLLNSFVFGNLDAIYVGCIFFTAFVLLLVGLNLLLCRQSRLKKNIISGLMGLIVIFIACYEFYYSYSMNPVPSWPQMTTGPAFIAGLFYVVSFMCMIYHFYSPNGNKKIGLISIMGIFVPLLTIAGSNTGMKHVTLGLWIMAPVVVYTVLSMLISPHTHEIISGVTSKFGCPIKKLPLRLAIIITIFAFGIKYTHFIYYTTNFDTVHRSGLIETVNSDKVKWIKTTPREAEAINGVLESIEPFMEDSPLVVYGSALLYYYMTGMESFVQPWVTNNLYANEELNADLYKYIDEFEELPVIIYCRTSTNYGFELEGYETLIKSMKDSTGSGKKEVLDGFLKTNNYTVHYFNDYFAVFMPSSRSSNLETPIEEIIGKK